MSSISMDTAYHARLRKKIKEYQDILASSNPAVMIQDTPERKGFVQSGNTPYNMDNVVVGGKKKGLAKTLKTIGQFVKPLGKSLKPVKHALMERAVYELGAPMYRGKTHAPVMAEYDDGHIPEAYELGLPALPKGGKVNRRKKATKWLGFAKDVAETGLNIFDDVKSRVGGKVNRRKKATKWLGFAKDVADTGLNIFDDVKSRVGGRAPSPWIAEVKATRAQMEKESGGQVSYKAAMQEASRRRKA